jgi:uncharacterized protein (DUF433 family)
MVSWAWNAAWKENAVVVLRTDSMPLRVDETGTIRVGPTRVTLDVVLSDYLNGMTPEEIVSQMDTLALADVYGAISYYWRHRDEIDAYLQKRRIEADALRKKIEAQDPDRANLRAKLMARLAERGIKLQDI